MTMCLFCFFFSAEFKKLGHIITSDFIYIILEVVHSGFHVLFISHISLPSLNMLHCVDSSDFVRNCQSESLALTP